MSVAPPNLARFSQAALAGTRVGRYEILTQIASGGMATVYLARALGAGGFQRLVAIKALHAHVADDEVFTSMFMDEARLAARIRHPNVVPTLDLENGAEGLFLVMEFVEGDSLVGLVRALARAQMPLSPAITLRVMLDVLQGLRAAHELTDDEGALLNLVHRDVSPHNILLGVDGITKITDFGVARANARIGITREGQIKGKLSYMAPEQTTGDPVDARADIFSAGIVLWECLAGKRLFQAETDAAVVRKLIDMPIPHLREVAPEYPQEIDAVCAKALERDPANRYSTAADFAEALETAGMLVGIATQRAVGALVRDLVAPKLAALRGSVRPSANVPAPGSSTQTGSGAPGAHTAFGAAALSGDPASSGGNPRVAASGSHPHVDRAAAGHPSNPSALTSSSILEVTSSELEGEDAPTSLREIPAPASSSDAGMIVPLVRSASRPPPPVQAAYVPPPQQLLPIVYPRRASGRFGWPVAVGLVLIGMVGVLVVVMLARNPSATPSPSAGAGAQSNANGKPTTAASTNGKTTAGSGSARPGASAGGDALSIDKLPSARATAQPSSQTTTPFNARRAAAPIAPHPTSGPAPGTRPKPPSTGGGDTFDPESL